VSRASAALFLSLLAACAPVAVPRQVFVDSYYTSTVDEQTSPYDGDAWVYEDPAYLLRYSLGNHLEGSGPGSIKLELEAKRPVRISWDKSTFVYADGNTSPITHEGVAYRFRPADTELAPGELLEDRVVPCENLVLSGEGVTNALYLVTPASVGENHFGLRLVINNQTLDIQLDGTRQ